MSQCTFLLFLTQYNSSIVTVSKMIQPPVFFGTTNVDPFGNISVPQNLVPRNQLTPPPSPPWGFRTEKTITMNVLYRLQPFGILPAIDSQGQTGNVVLCSLIPSFGIQRDLAKHQRNRMKMVQDIRKKKRVGICKPFSLSATKPCKLKRLQRGPLLKAKKQEIYKKWEDKKWRKQFWRRQRQKSTNALVSGGPESPFQCPLWNCKRKRSSRREDFECDGYRGGHHKWSMSDLSNRRDRSRSPIKIRSSPVHLR